MSIFKDLGFSDEEILVIEEKIELMTTIHQKIEGLKVKDLKTILNINEETAQNLHRRSIGSFTVEQLRFLYSQVTRGTNEI